MSACQSLVILNNELLGDPLELELLKYTDFEIVNDLYEDGVVECKLTRLDKR